MSIPFWDKFRQARNAYKSATRRKMKEFLGNKTASFFGSSKNFWTFYKSVVKTKKRSGLSSVKNINIDGRAISEQKEIANSFNSYFTNIQLPSYCTVEDSKEFLSSTFLSRGHSKKLVPPKNGFSLEHASHSEIIRLIGKLHDSSSAGISCIATGIIKACAEE